MEKEEGHVIYASVDKIWSDFAVPLQVPIMNDAEFASTLVKDNM